MMKEWGDPLFRLYCVDFMAYRHGGGAGGNLMASGKGGVVPQVERIAAPIAQQLGLQIWDIEFVKEGASWFLRFYIDKDGGVTIDDCEAFSRAVDGPLDEADPIPQSYYMEVSSPGIERELRRDAHFARYMGSRVRVRLIRPAPDGERELEGELSAYEDGRITLLREGQPFTVAKNETAFVRLCDDSLGGGDE